MRAIGLSVERVTLGAALTAATILSGCAPLAFTDEKGSLHYLVLGIGLVSVPNPAAEVAVLATKVQALGITVSNQPGLKFNVGYNVASVVAIPNRASDVRVEVSEVPGGAVVVDAQSAILREMQSVLGESPK